MSLNKVIASEELDLNRELGKTSMNYSIEMVRLLAVVLITFTHLRHDFISGPMYFILEELPKYGTLVLSVISGYLFWEISSSKENFLIQKLKSLFVPYLIANLLVLLPVLVFNYFGYNFLNRLTFDYSLITEGIFSLNAPPINPPTYFIRDLLVVFLLCDLVLNRNLKVLLVIIPLFVFGKILLRYDILVMFMCGAFYSQYNKMLSRKEVILLAIFLTIAFTFLPNDLELQKYALVIVLFLLLMKLEISFFNTGGYTYLLHLYHSPIIVLLFPLINKTIADPYVKIIVQLVLVFSLVFILFKCTGKIKWLRGGR